MEPATIVAIVIAALSGLGIVITLIALVIRGGFLLGRLVGQVDSLGKQVEGLTNQVAALAAAVNELRAEVQQSNQTLAALANHTHDTDGRTVFQVPPSVSR